MSSQGRVVADFVRPSAALVETARLPAATLHEAYGRRGDLPAAIKPIEPLMRVCGPALTVWTAPGNNLLLHHAIYAAQPGDVLVVDCSAGYDFGYLGEIMAVAALERGLNGVVIDGCVRDRDSLAALGFPVFARGLCIKGTVKDRDPAGAINRPLRFGFTEVNPGDVIVGDADGVVAIAHADLSGVVERAREREAREIEQVAQVRSGMTTVDIFDLVDLD